MTDLAPALTKEEFTARVIAEMKRLAGFEKFDDGTTVDDHGKDVAESMWGKTNDSPEEVARGDFEYWGEE